MSMSFLWNSSDFRNKFSNVSDAINQGGIAPDRGGLFIGASSLNETGTWSDRASLQNGFPQIPADAFASMMSSSNMSEWQRSILETQYTSSSRIVRCV